MKQTIGVIGSTGDLGAQLLQRLRDRDFEVRECAPSLNNSITINDIAAQCDIVHFCAPLAALTQLTAIPKGIIILHDSVMSSSKQASERFLESNGAVVHMLMNDQQSVVVARDMPHSQPIAEHMAALECVPHFMTVREHDTMIARTQGPLALLCETLLPYLNTIDDHGLLTPSGQLLTQTLRSRELAWTRETIHSILQNPELKTLLHDMQQTLAESNKKTL